ncbi:DUF6268 family outer membrane beta-barrel protein [Mucilaginibacter aquatilis]|uniref:DUF6268 domain-containing protein n=1 Tax=Mucilaginibacter aquatilis TaxID=1517760 RepID=A0A6I4IQI6_9SPHI|nr:DUF6268 family outer membrane beta-barrel protein [Mucilaginibacter aquatilis]MVN91773.1 hypothetical protein [Mucilaginibacter aquatilis]
MKIYNNYILLFFILTNSAFAQSQADAYRKRMMDSIKNVYLIEAAIRNPALRQASITTDVTSGSNIENFVHGNKIFDGTMQVLRTSALFNVPVHQWGKNSISATFSAFQQRFHLSNITPYQPNLPDLEGKVFNKFTVGFTGTFLRVDSLFGHQVVYSASISGVTSRASSIQKLSYLGAVIFSLKQTPKVRTSVGLFINIDPSINVPVVPFFTYWRKLNNDLELNVNLPQQLTLRKGISPKLWATLGTSLSGSIAFFRHNQPGIPQDGNFSTIDLKTGPGIEYRFAKKFIFGLNAGFLTNLQSREFEVNSKANDYFLRNKVNPSFFGSFSVSVLPFL